MLGHAQSSNHTVLYVEDEESDALLMQMAFEREGLGTALRVVGNGQLAIDYLAGTGNYVRREQHPVPTMVLLDLNLPVLPGFEVLKWIRRSAPYKETPVVIFSSSSRHEDKVLAAELGANDYFEKPNSVRLFGDLVRKLKEKWLRPN